MNAVSLTICRKTPSNRCMHATQAEGHNEWSPALVKPVAARRHRFCDPDPDPGPILILMLMLFGEHAARYRTYGRDRRRRRADTIAASCCLAFPCLSVETCLNMVGLRSSALLTFAWETTHASPGQQERFTGMAPGTGLRGTCQGAHQRFLGKKRK